MKSLGTFQVQNKTFNLHIIQVMYNIGAGEGPEDILEHTDVFTYGKREPTLQIPTCLRHELINYTATVNPMSMLELLGLLL